MERAMLPAVEEKAADVEDALGDLIDSLADRHGFD
jgi:hypothetical protein